MDRLFFLVLMAIVPWSLVAKEIKPQTQNTRKGASARIVEFHSVEKDLGESELCPEKIILNLDTQGKILSVEVSTIPKPQHILISGDGQSIGLFSANAEYVQSNLINFVYMKGSKRRINFREDTSSDTSTCQNLEYDEK